VLTALVGGGAGGAEVLEVGVPVVDALVDELGCVSLLTGSGRSPSPRCVSSRVVETTSITKPAAIPTIAMMARVVRYHGTCGRERAVQSMLASNPSTVISST
jgi:hypothetical protein